MRFKILVSRLCGFCLCSTHLCMYKKIIKYWPLFLLLFLTFLLRIYHLEKLFYFTYDEEVPAFVGRRLLLWYHIPLIGGATPFGFHLAPYFYWIYAFLLYFSKLNPIIWGYASAILSGVIVLLVFSISRSLRGKKLAITAAIFWTFSYLAIIYDRHLWALYWGAIISLVVIYSLHKIIKGKEKFVYLLAITLALGIHADLSNLIFIALSIIVWIIYKIPFKRSTLLALLFIPLFTLPLVAFDIRHDFANTKPVTNFLEKAKSANKPGFSIQKFEANTLLFPRALSRLAYTFGDNQVAKQYSYCKEFIEEKYAQIPFFILFISSIILLFFTISFLVNTNPIKKMISLTVILYYLGIQFYGTLFQGDIFEHYITGLLPLLIIIFAYFISLLPKKLWLVVLGLFVAANLYKLSILQNSQGLTEKRKAVEYTMYKIGDQPFSLESLSTCWRMNGYRYLFAVFGREPVKSYVDPNFAYLYGTTQVWEHHPPTVVAFVVRDYAPETPDFYRRYALLRSHEISSELFGSIEVIIMDNSKNWFD